MSPTQVLRSIVVLLLISLLKVEAVAAAPAARRILFLGDSITYSGQYIDYLETWLHLRFPQWQGELINVGLPSETVSGLSEDGHAGGQFPRPDLHERLERVLGAVKPDLVVACYGMNDGIYLPLDEGRFQRFKDGILKLRERVEKAVGPGKIIHVTPATFDPPAGSKAGHNYNDVLDRYSEWLVGQRQQGWQVVDVHTWMNRHIAGQRRTNPAYRLAGDGVHPNETGQWVIAQPVLRFFGAGETVEKIASAAAMVSEHPKGAEILKLVQERQRLMKDAWLSECGHKRPGMKKGMPIAEAAGMASGLNERIWKLAAPFPGKQGVWNGFPRYDFEVAGKGVSVIVPETPLPGRFWAWKGEFLDAFPAAEIALLKKGVYIVYVRTPDMLGNPEVVGQWTACYEGLTREHGFAPKVALIALSRAGLYCYNWAVANPTRVACIYADAAVCDFKSWPGGKGKGKGSARDWKLVLERYGFKSDAEALAFKGNPVDNLEPLAKAGIPLLHVYGDSDDVVPWEENTGVVAERYKRLGGSIQLIAKAGVGHHPHGLADPNPIVDFVLKHTAGR